MSESELYPSMSAEELPVCPEVAPEAVAAAHEAELWHRRTVLKRGLQLAALGGLAATAGVNALADLVVTDTEVARLLEQERISIDLVDDSAEKLLPHQGTLVVAGFNVGQPRQTVAEPLRESLKHYGRLWSADLGQQPLDLGTFTGRVIGHCRENDVTSLSLVGHSMGGMITVALAAELAEAGIAVPMVCDISTPGDYLDVKDWSDAIGQGVPEFLYEHELSGGFVTRTCINYVQDLKHRSEHLRDDLSGPAILASHQGLSSSAALGNLQRYDLKELVAKNFSGIGQPALSKAWEKATSEHELSDLQNLSQLVFMTDNPVERWADAVPAETAIVYIGAMDPNKDGTVNVTTAEPKFRAAFDKDGRLYLHLRDPAIGHADPGAHPWIYNQLIDYAGKWSGLPDVRNMPQPRQVRPGIFGPR